MGELLTIDETAERLRKTPSTVRRWIAQRGLPVHALRHTANTIMAQSGVDERTRMAILGHANVRVNARYVHSDSERIRAAVDALEDRIRTG